MPRGLRPDRHSAGLSAMPVPPAAVRPGDSLSMFYFVYIAEQVNHADGHYSHGSGLSYGVAGKAHEQREHRSAEQTHYHKSRNLVLLVGFRQQSLREHYREYVRVAVTYKGDGILDVPKSIPNMLSAIITTLITKNVLLFMTRRKNEPVRHPTVRKMK